MQGGNLVKGTSVRGLHRMLAGGMNAPLFFCRKNAEMVEECPKKQFLFCEFTESTQ